MSDFELPKDAVSSTRSKKPTPEKSLNSPTLGMSPVDPTSDKNPVEEKEAPKWTKEELLAVFDEIIFSNTYSENVVIRNKLKVKFRIRTAEEVEAISLSLDSTSANLMATVQEKRLVLNLQYSLVHYQGTDLGNLTLAARVAFINKLPAPVVGALIGAMSKFEEKVYAACAEGEENF